MKIKQLKSEKSKSEKFKSDRQTERQTDRHTHLKEVLLTSKIFCATHGHTDKQKEGQTHKNPFRRGATRLKMDLALVVHHFAACRCEIFSKLFASFLVRFQYVCIKLVSGRPIDRQFYQ